MQISQEFFVGGLFSFFCLEDSKIYLVYGELEEKGAVVHCFWRAGATGDG